MYIDEKGNEFHDETEAIPFQCGKCGDWHREGECFNDSVEGEMFSLMVEASHDDFDQQVNFHPHQPTYCVECGENTEGQPPFCGKCVHKTNSRD